MLRLRKYGSMPLTPAVALMYFSKFGLLTCLVIIWLTSLYVLPDVVNSFYKISNERTTCTDSFDSSCRNKVAFYDYDESARWNQPKRRKLNDLNAMDSMQVNRLHGMRQID